jgi:soluble lytic murein transglycosylase-like protein
MRPYSKSVKIKLFFLVLGALLVSPSCATAEASLLRKIIVLRNQADFARSLRDGSYRGEAGILRMKPEVAESFGMKVFINQDYLDAVTGFARAEAFLDRAKAAMASQEKEPQPGNNIRIIAENYLNHIRALGEAKQSLARYQERLAAEADDRLRDDVSQEVLDGLLGESLKKADKRLRDGLGFFYNASRGIGEKESALTPENVEFVNEVFQRFVAEASGKNPSPFGLDRLEDYRHKRPWRWKQVFPDTFPYTSLIEDTVEKLKAKDCETDPLLFLALIKRESNFDAYAVSNSGAAGLTQMMPATALELGVRTVFLPDYLAETGALMEQERKTRAQAMAALYGIKESNMLTLAAEAQALMQRAMELSLQREKLQLRYRRELLESRADDRLNPLVAIEFGYRYFCALMKEHGGDISLALAAYNAGAGRVRDYKGVPPFGETVRFRNRVLDYYREYLSRIKTLED